MDRRVTPPKWVTTPTRGPYLHVNRPLVDETGQPANIKHENDGAAVYVGSFLTMRKPLFSVHKQ